MQLPTDIVPLSFELNVCTGMTLSEWLFFVAISLSKPVFKITYMSQWGQELSDPPMAGAAQLSSRSHGWPPHGSVGKWAIRSSSYASPQLDDFHGYAWSFELQVRKLLNFQHLLDSEVIPKCRTAEGSSSRYASWLLLLFILLLHIW